MTCCSGPLGASLSNKGPGPGLLIKKSLFLHILYSLGAYKSVNGLSS